jgi:hypothetical protein
MLNVLLYKGYEFKLFIFWFTVIIAYFKDGYHPELLVVGEHEGTFDDKGPSRDVSYVL